MELKDEFHDQSVKPHKMTTSVQQNNPTKPILSTLTRKLTDFFSTDLTDQEKGTQKEKRARLISKRGRVNVVAINVERRNLRFFADCFTTLIDCKWYWIGLVFSACFLTSWLVFGSLWWFIVWLRTRNNARMICVENVNSWTSAFLFSIETQTTIGYGGRQVGSKLYFTLRNYDSSSMCLLPKESLLLKYVQLYNFVRFHNIQHLHDSASFFYFFLQ